MDKHIEVVGVDHGWSGMKTVSLDRLQLTGQIF